jgi:hypothetical protein
MSPKSWLLLIAGVLALSAGSVSAHHAYGSIYREDEVVAIEGDLVDFIHRNPHSYLHVRAPDRSSQMRLWAVECGSSARLRLKGLIGQTLKPGDRVVVTGSPGRDAGTWRLRLRSIERPSDGWRWSDAGQ